MDWILSNTFSGVQQAEFEEELTRERREKQIKAISRGDTESKDVFNNSERVCGKHFVSGKPTPYQHKHDVDWVATLQLAKKNYGAQLDHDAEREKGQRSDMNQRGRTRAATIAAENVESLWKAVLLLLRSTSVSQLLRQIQKKREIETKGMRRPFLLIRRPYLLPKGKRTPSVKPSSLTTCFRQRYQAPVLHRATVHGNTNDCFGARLLTCYRTNTRSADFIVNVPLQDQFVVLLSTVFRTFSHWIVAMDTFCNDPNVHKRIIHSLRISHLCHDNFACNFFPFN